MKKSEEGIKIIGVLYPNLGEPDEQGDIIDAKEFKKYLDKELDEFIPVTYKFNGFPIGRVVRIWIEDNNLMGEVVLSKELFHIAFRAKECKTDGDKTIISEIDLMEVSCHLE